MQGTYETFVEVGRQHYGGDFAGRWILTAGLGGMGGAQPLAAVMAGASCLAVECQPSRIEMRLKNRLPRPPVEQPRRGPRRSSPRSCRDSTPVSVGLLGNAAEIYPELVRRGVRPDAVTDQTSAHDPVNGYLPRGWTLEQWAWAREHDPEGSRAGGAGLDGRAGAGDARVSQVRACRPSTTATTSARWPRTRASPTPSTFPASCRPTSARCSAAGSARSAGSRSPAIRRTSTGPTKR